MTNIFDEASFVVTGLLLKEKLNTHKMRINEITKQPFCISNIKGKLHSTEQHERDVQLKVNNINIISITIKTLNSTRNALMILTTASQ